MSNVQYQPQQRNVQQCYSILIQSQKKTSTTNSKDAICCNYTHNSSSSILVVPFPKVLSREIPVAIWLLLLLRAEEEE